MRSTWTSNVRCSYPGYVTRPRAGAPGVKRSFISTRNHLPNSVASLRARHTLERGARMTISFSIRSVLIAVISNLLVAYYTEAGTTGNRLVAFFSGSALPRSAPSSVGIDRAESTGKSGVTCSTRGNHPRAAAPRNEWKRLAGRNPAEFVGTILGEPERSIRTGSNDVRPGVRRGSRDLGNHALRGDPPDPLAGDLGEPESAVPARRDPVGVLRGSSLPKAGSQPGEVGDVPGRSDSPDLVIPCVDEPQIAIRPCRDLSEPRAAERLGSKQSDHAFCRDATDPAGECVTETEGSVWTGHDALGICLEHASERRDRKLGDRSGGSDSPDLVTASLGEPDVAIRTGADAEREAFFRRHIEFRDDPLSRSATDPVGAVLSEPESTIGPEGDPGGQAARRRERILGHCAVRCHAADPVSAQFCEPKGPVPARRNPIGPRLQTRNVKLDDLLRARETAGEDAEREREEYGFRSSTESRRQNSSTSN